MSSSFANVNVNANVNGGGEDGNQLFTRIPVEIQLEIVKYLDPPSVRNMRLVNSRWNEGITNLIPFNYKRAILSDRTADHVLPFPSPIRSLTVTELTSRRRVLTAIAPFGVVRWATELILGERIDPRIAKKLLKTATEVGSLALAPLDPSVGEAFLRFPALFENVTQFQLKITSPTSHFRLKEEEYFLRKLSHWRKFPNLLKYSVAWNLDTLTTVERGEDILLLHSIYISLHNFLYTHRATVQGISWDFDNLMVLGLPDYLRNVGDYVRVKKRMTLVSLKEVDVRMSDMEGQDYWDLNKTLLRNQYSLTRIRFTGAMQHLASRPLRFLTYPFSVVTELVEQNCGSLVELEIENRVFSFYSIEGCSELRRLVLKGASVVSTTPLNQIEAEYEIEELVLDFKFIFPPDILNLMNWFVKLPKLRILDLRLKMQWTSSEIFPNSRDFADLLALPSLTSLALHFDASTAYKLHVLKQKGEEFKERWETWGGIRISGQHSWKDKTFSIHVQMDRNLFKGPGSGAAPQPQPHPHPQSVPVPMVE